MTVAVVIVTALVARPVHAADKDKKTNILLTLRVDVTQRTVIKVQPRDAKIWRNTPDKPKKVMWIAINNTTYEEVFWEIRYAPSKGGESANYFGDVNIECGESEIKAQPDKKPEIAHAEWPYSVTAYGCVDGEKAQKLAVLDPRIIWKD
jgi:hypothetical protein